MAQSRKPPYDLCPVTGVHSRYPLPLAGCSVRFRSGTTLVRRRGCPLPLAEYSVRLRSVQALAATKIAIVPREAAITTLSHRDAVRSVFLDRYIRNIAGHVMHIPSQDSNSSNVLDQGSNRSNVVEAVSLSLDRLPCCPVTPSFCAWPIVLHRPAPVYVKHRRVRSALLRCSHFATEHDFRYTYGKANGGSECPLQVVNAYKPSARHPRTNHIAQHIYRPKGAKGSNSSPFAASSLTFFEDEPQFSADTTTRH